MGSVFKSIGKILFDPLNISGLFSPSAPKAATPPPVPIPPPSASPPTSADAGTAESAANARSRAAAAAGAGFNGTLQTGPQGLTAPKTAQATLLGG